MPTRGSAYVPSLLEAQRVAQRFDGELLVEIGRPIELVRTRIVTRFMESGADYLLTIDDDIIAPADAAERLLALDAAVATAVYPQWLDDRLLTNVQARAGAAWSESVPPSVFPVRRCLLGCVLVRREVFEKIPAPRFLSTISGSRFIADDEWFCDAVQRTGLRLLCDGRITCGSIRQGTDLLPLMGERIHTG